MRSNGALVLLGLLLAVPGVGFQIDFERSLVAVVTHKEGVAAGLAHEHLVAVRRPSVKLRFDSDALLDSRFDLELRVEELEADAPDLQMEWEPWLLERGILAAPKDEVSAKDRAKIRKAMLEPGQLDADRFPAIRLRVLGLREEKLEIPSLPSLEGFPVTISYEIEIKGKKTRGDAAASWQLRDGELRIEAVGELSFSELGIEPYSALFGAIRNADRLHLVLVLVGVEEPSPPASAEGSGGGARDTR